MFLPPELTAGNEEAAVGKNRPFSDA